MTIPQCSTPSEIIEDFQMSSEEVSKAIVANRIDIINKLKAIADDLAASAINSDDLKLKLAVSDKVSVLYKRVEDIYKSLIADSGGDFATDAVFNATSGYAEKLPRAEVWRRYVADCKRSGRPPMKKGEFFQSLKRIGFTESITKGNIMLLPPGTAKRRR